MSPRGGRRVARERILAAAVGRIAREGLEGVRIARIAMDAGVSPALVHYHFATREALLAEALEYSYTRAVEGRLGADGAEEVQRPAEGSEPASHAERLSAMIDACLPGTPALRDDWVLWIELWLQAARGEQLRPFAGELYSRLHAWFADQIAAGVSDQEFVRCDPDEVADRTLALLDGIGVRTLIGDPQMPLSRARQTVRAALARDLGLGERLVKEEAGSRQDDAPAPRARRQKTLG